MTDAAQKRIMCEYTHDILKEPNVIWSATPDEDNIFHWTATLRNIPAAKHSGKTYNLDITFSKNYPFEPPTVIFLSRVNNIYVRSNGNICLDILSRNWSPALTIGKVLLSICSMLADDPF